MYAQYSAIVATIAIEITVATVIVNFFGTLFGRTDMVRSNLSIRWFYTGMSLMFVDLVAAGLVQGFTWKSLAPWADSINFSMPFWLARTLFGLMIIVGQVLLFYNVEHGQKTKPGPGKRRSSCSRASLIIKRC